MMSLSRLRLMTGKASKCSTRKHFIAAKTLQKFLVDDCIRWAFKWKHYQPQTDDFMSSETPKERAPMKSFLVGLSQSHTSTDSRRSLSEGFSLLQKAETTDANSVSGPNYVQFQSCHSSYSTTTSLIT